MIGSVLLKCCGLKKVMAARRSDGEDTFKEAERFLTLFKSDWSDCMSCPASAAVKANTYNKPDILPSTEDMLKLKRHSRGKTERTDEAA